MNGSAVYEQAIQRFALAAAGRHGKCLKMPQNPHRRLQSTMPPYGIPSPEKPACRVVYRQFA